MNLLRAAATVSGLTLLSRITGLVRENLTAMLFGASAMTDAFFVAFRLPNLLRRMFAEGAFSQAFVPILARMKSQNSQAEVKSVIDQVATCLFWAVLVVSIAGVIGAPALVWATASGLAQDPQAFDAAIIMTRWMFPYIGLISMVALAAGILNTWRKFAVPAAAPVALNLSVIACAWGLSSQFERPIYSLAAGVVLGGILQVAMQWLALGRLGLIPRIHFNPRAAFRNPIAREILQKMAPAVLAVSVAQISLLINTHIASRLAAGSVSWVTYGDRLMEFPSALLGVALGTVLLPSLSNASARSDTVQYNQLLDWGLRLTLVFAVPAMVGLGLLAQPLTALLFHYGKFTDRDVVMTAQAVSGYAVGLVALIAIKVLAPGFYARQDVRTPVKIALFVLVITQLLNLVLVPRLAHAGLAWSISMAAWLNAGLLLWGLRRAEAYHPLAGWGAFTIKVMLAAVSMGLAVWWASGFVDWLAWRETPWRRAAALLGLIAVAAGIYFSVLLALGVRVREFLKKAEVK
jgi:putative peptidoglycan lipid II flippase